MVKLGRRTGFTLIELLIVIGILAILATMVVLIINPAELFREARDGKRLGELNTLNKALQLMEVLIPSVSFGLTNTVYVSLPDTSSTCPSYTLPSLPSGWAYKCVLAADLYKINGSGWIPVDFSAVPATPLSTLPVDPINDGAHYYAYVTGGSWTLSALLESSRYAEQAATDGGPDPTRYEVGTNLAIAPFISGMVGYWRFDNNFNDSSGLGNNGTGYNGANFVSGKIGQAGNFDGVDNYVGVADNSALDIGLGSMTWLMWTKTGVAPRGVIYRKSDSANANGVLIDIGGTVAGRFRCYVSNSALATAIINSAATTYNDNQWHLLGCILDRSDNTLRLSIDGVQNGSVSASIISGSNLNAGAGVLIGQGGTAFFNGSIDEVRVYNRALTENEVLAAYNATK